MVVVKTFTARHPLFTRLVLCAQANPPSLGLRTSRWSSSYQRLLPMDRMDVYSFQRFTLMTDWSTYDKNTKAKDAAACIENVAFSPTDHDCERDPHPNHQRSVKEASGECQGRVTGIQCVTDGSRCLRLEEEGPFGDEQLLLVGNVGGALGALPSSPSFSASLPGLRFASAYNPDAQNPDYPRK
ncbi:hypothetical protein ARMGADRAFT_1087799 [Armillaria gallica]|uniref:Uncharacterized protein n=1 Tax=Armillaria gallica TaxID=47427 RepID=A0A2H3D142_ARMGA|nr:hypothetical protein ARMGADRAFT_1087799 [Armillaria gallica]